MYNIYICFDIICTMQIIGLDMEDRNNLMCPWTGCKLWFSPTQTQVHISEFGNSWKIMKVSNQNYTVSLCFSLRFKPWPNIPQCKCIFSRHGPAQHALVKKVATSAQRQMFATAGDYMFVTPREINNGCRQNQSNSVDNVMASIDYLQLV